MKIKTTLLILFIALGAFAGGFQGFLVALGLGSMAALIVGI